MSVTDLFKSENVYTVVLCGGSGTRLWPMSRKSFPKQFLKLGGESQSLLQTTIDRITHISPKEKRWIVTSQPQAADAQKQVGDRIGRTVVEPQAKNTAGAIALAASALMAQDPEAIMVILSSDHVIQNVRSFEQSIRDAVTLAQQNLFVTVGIRPTFPATGFGYIELGLPLDATGNILGPDAVNRDPSAGIGYSVRSFREKPHAAAAEQFLRTNRYLWNAGIFVWKAKAFWNAFAHIQPEMALLLESQDPNTLAERYSKLESHPIDTAFIEQTSHIACVPANFDWNDVGSWSAVGECFSSDEEGNTVAGDVITVETKNSVIQAGTSQAVAVVGMESVVVVTTEDAILVMPREKSQDVKKVIAQLERQQRLNLL